MDNFINNKVMKKAIIIILIILCVFAILTAVRQTISLRQYKDTVEEVEALKTKIIYYEFLTDSIMTEYHSRTTLHGQDTMRIIQKYEQQNQILKNKANKYYEKIKSIDNITADSAYRYLSDRYRL